ETDLAAEAVDKAVAAVFLCLNVHQAAQRFHFIFADTNRRVSAQIEADQVIGRQIAPAHDDDTAVVFTQHAGAHAHATFSSIGVNQRNLIPPCGDVGVVHRFKR